MRPPRFFFGRKRIEKRRKKIGILLTRANGGDNIVIMIKTIKKEEFIELYKHNSINALSKKLGVSTVTIWKWAKKFGLPSKKQSLIEK